MRKNVLLLFNAILAHSNNQYQANSGSVGSNRMAVKSVLPGALIKSFFTALVFVFCFAFSITNLLAQVTKEWDNTIGGSRYDNMSVLQPTTDGGYILGGTSMSDASEDKSENSNGGQDMWVVKLNAAGIIEWENTIMGTDLDFFSYLQQTKDGGYLLGGSSYSNAGGDKSQDNKGGGDFWLVKLNAAGRIEWDKTIGGPTTDGLNFLQQTADGGFVLGGESYSGPGADKSEIPRGVSADYWVVKLDAAGNKEWDKTLGGRNYDVLTSVRQTVDGGYIVGGYSTNGSGASGDRSEPSRGGVDYWVVKLNPAGRIEWEKTLGGLGDDYLRTAYQTPDGGYILGGSSSSPVSGDKEKNAVGGTDYWLVKLGATGIKQWEQTFLVSQVGLLRPAPEDGFLLGGLSAILKLDNAGRKIWERNYDLGFKVSLNSFEQTNGGGFILGGTSAADAGGFKSENPKGQEDYWVLKLSVSENPVTQTITFAPIPDKVFGDPPFSLDATASSGLPVTYTLVSGNATIAGNTITLTGVGQVTVRAVQAGNADFFQTSAERTFTVRRTAPPAIICDLALISKVTQAEPWYDMWGPFNGAGAIDLTVTGGTAPYTYKWNAGLTTQDIPAASPGRYTVTVTDAKGCTAMTTVFVGRKNDPLTLSTSYINVSDAGVADGSVDLSVLGGVGPLTYSWSNGATTEDITGLAIGRYFVIVTDAFGKFAFTWVQISETGTPLELTAGRKDVSNPGGDDGFIDLTVVGGVGPYTYRWNNGATTQDLPRVAAGVYSVIVTDARGATATTSVDIWQPDIPSLVTTRSPSPTDLFQEKETSLMVYPNPVIDRATVNITVSKAGNYTLDLYDLRGAKVKTISTGLAVGNKTMAVEVNLAGHAEGIYLLRLVTDKAVMTKRIVVKR